VHLVAAVFLHISYDLPRVLGNEWPQKGIWSAGPSEARGERLYFDLRSIFSDILSNNARRLAISGIFAPILWLVPLMVIGNLVHWVSHLREGAWRHGATLADLNANERAQTLALADVNNLPWTFTLPEPPNVVMRSVAIVIGVLVVIPNC
jgi:hypothetical protein